jgi:hypothetical protein
MSNEPENRTPDEERPDLEVDRYLYSLFSPRPEEPEPQEEPEPETPERLSRIGQTLRAHWRFVLFVFLAALAICVACLLIFGGRRLTGRVERVLRYTGDETVFSLDAHSSNRYRCFRSGLAVASPDGLQCYDAGGSQTALVQNQFDTPVVLCGENLALAYSVGGSTICTAHYSKGEQLNLTIPGTLIDADLSADGYICCASSQSGYKTVLNVIDPAGAQTYSWFSSTHFFSQCAVSERGSVICAVALGLDGGRFTSSAVTFDTSQSDPIAEFPLSGDLVYDLAFVGGRTLCAVGETALQFFDIDGSRSASYSYEGGELLNYDLCGDGFVAIVCNMNQAGSRYRIATVSTGGTELASLPLDETVQDVSANGKYLAVLTSGGLRVYDSRLRLCLSEDDVGFATRVCVQRDGAALLIDGSTARRIS